MIQKQLELGRERKLEEEEFRDSLKQERTWRVAVARAALKDEVRSGMQRKAMLNV